jgi:zinc and cadmium transporter
MNFFTPLVLIITYCVLILIASLVGGWIPLFIRLTHRRMEIAISFVSGLMLGVAVLHMLPHALEASQSVADITTIMLWLLAGFLIMFFIERFFCFHHHDAEEEDGGGGCSHGHSSTHQLTWSGAAVGLTLHSIIAGIALAASVESQSHTNALAGLGTFIVIFLHKPFDSLTLGTLMAKGEWSAKARHWVNALFSLAIPAGVLIFHFIYHSASHENYFVNYALAFSAGTFFCIAMSDLLPELQFHHHDRLKLSLALILGLVLAWTIAHFEQQTHSENHNVQTETTHRGHNH